MTPAQVATLELIELGLIDYDRALAEQRATHTNVAEGTTGSTVLLLEHPPVFTAGRRTEPHERPLDGTPVIDVDRGGKITWHGPGQIVGYPIFKLPEGMGVVDYVRLLESILIDTCAEFDLATGRVSGRSGVWVDGARKVAAIGVRVERGVTLHGFALNINPDLTWYDRIIPCGIADATVTSLSHELNKDLTTSDVLPVLRAQLMKALA
jgi:lipoyl(octanoyl) transferase